MGSVQKLNGHKREEAGGATSAVVEDPGRERLRAVASELAKARKALDDAHAHQDRLIAIIREAEAAEAAVKAAVASDGGKGLKDFSDGKGSADIARLVTAHETTKAAAAVAKLSLPDAQAVLNATKAECSRLEQVIDDAAIVYLKRRAAADEHRAYLRAFNDLCSSYDRLCGIAVALSATNHSEMMTTALPVPVQAPGFNTSAGEAHGPSELVVMSHTANDAVVANAHVKWAAARERLRQDAHADVEELLGPQFQYEADRDL